MLKKWFNLLFKKKKRVKNDEQIDLDLLTQLEKFREDTKSLDYLRKELEEANKGKSDVEVVESLAKVLQNEQKKKA